MRFSRTFFNAAKSAGKAPIQALSGSELVDAADILRRVGWKLSQDKRYLSKTFSMGSFSNAWAFLTQVAMHSHLKGHHPRIHNLYDMVNLTLHTDDCDGISEKDIAMAKKVETLARTYEKEE